MSSEASEALLPPSSPTTSIQVRSADGDGERQTANGNAASSASSSSATAPPPPPTAGVARNGSLIVSSRTHSDTMAVFFKEQDASALAARRDTRSPLYHLYRLFKSLPMQIIMVLVTIVDVSFLLYEFITSDVHLAVVTLFTALAFFLEMIILWSFEGTRQFFRVDKWWLIAEVLIVTVSFLVEYVEYILEATIPTLNITSDLRYLRAVRFLRVLIMWKTRYRNLTSALRRLVSADRRRYQQDGYDLDLTYVHPRVIAMSWPSEKSESLYRNQIDVVAQFLDEKHPDGSYCVYNLCSERTYDESKFHFQTKRYLVDDHNPPELRVMLEFAQAVASFIQRNPKKNVAVIHCKGGKGRTGTMTCAYLLFAGIKKSASSALEYFGKVRTSDNAKSFQGVESPSQDRYVRYFERLLKMPNYAPPRRKVRLTKLVLHDVPFRWWAEGGLEKLWFAMISNPSTDRKAIYVSNPTVTFDPVLPPNPLSGKKAAGKMSPLSPRPTQPATSARFSPRPTSTYLTANGGDDQPSQASLYSDDERGAATGTTSYFVNDEDDDASPLTAANGCQPFVSNMTFFVGRDMTAPMNYSEFQSKVLYRGEGPPAPGTTKSFYSASSGASGGATAGGPNGGGILSTAALAALDKKLRVSVAFSVQKMPVFENDMHITFFYNCDKPNPLSSPLQLWFHPSFELGSMVLTKALLDGPHKEIGKEKKYWSTMELQLEMETITDDA